MNTLRFSLAGLPALRWILALLLAATGQAVLAQTTDIANAPLFTSAGSSVKPNLMFILDDSGSMKYDYLPDEANFATTKYGKLTSQCNGVAYNPSITYSLPVDASGTALSPGSMAFLVLDPNTMTSNHRSLSSPASVVVPATVGTDLTLTVSGNSPRGSWYTVGDKVTIFSAGGTTTWVVGTVKSWSSSTRALVVTVSSSTGSATLGSGLTVGDGEPLGPTYYRYTGTETPMSYTYTSSGVITSTNFYRQCNSTIGSAPGSGVFTAVSVNSLSAEAQNYANWYAYYRDRMAMMKTSLSRAFQPIGSRYRVGYSTISETGVADGTDFLNVRDFDATQKGQFYTAMNAATPSGYTPLRGALSKAGQYFGKKARNQAIDPMQYSCQKNFTILSTDGYWNTDDETSTYGPFDLAGNKVGQRDGVNAYPTARPKFDGGTTTTTNTTRWNTTQTVVTQTATTTTRYSNVKITTTGTYADGTGSIATAYSGTTLTNSNLTRCTSGSFSGGNCTVTVDTSSNHGLSTGNRVTIVDAVPSVYNGTYTITRVDNNTYTYTITGLGSRPASPSSDGTTLLAGTCPAGQGSVTSTRTQTDTYPLTLTATTTADTTGHHVLHAAAGRHDNPVYADADGGQRCGHQRDHAVRRHGIGRQHNVAQACRHRDDHSWRRTVTTSAGTPSTITTPVGTPTAVCVSTVTPPAPVAAAPVSTKPPTPRRPPSPADSSTTGSPVTTTISDSGVVTGTKTTTQTGSSTSGGS